MLTGRVEEFSLADVFRLISLARRTGTLRVERQAGRGRVHFHRGDVILAESSLVRELLGEKLVRSGALTEGRLRRALDEQAAAGGRLGEVLVKAGSITPRALEDAVRGQTEDAVFDLLRWELGEFTWQPGQDVDAEVPIAVSVENLIMEASRRLDELDVITRRIPSTDAVLALVASPPEGGVEINITSEEWRLLLLVDGARSVADIARALEIEELSALRTLYGLVCAGLVEVTSGDGRARQAGEVGSPGALSWLEPSTIAPGDSRPGWEPVGEPPTAVDEEPTMPRTPGDRSGDRGRDRTDGAPSERPAEEARERPSLTVVDRTRGDEAASQDRPAASDASGGSPPPRRFEDPATTSPAAEEPGEERAERHSAVREAAGIFSDSEASTAAVSEEPPAEAGPGPVDRRKRVEDDEHVTKGLISRFIDGVKGL